MSGIFFTIAGKVALDLGRMDSLMARCRQSPVLKYLILSIYRRTISIALGCRLTIFNQIEQCDDDHITSSPAFCRWTHRAALLVVRLVVATIPLSPGRTERRVVARAVRFRVLARRPHGIHAFRVFSSRVHLSYIDMNKVRLLAKKCT